MLKLLLLYSLYAAIARILRAVLAAVENHHEGPSDSKGSPEYEVADNVIVEERRAHDSPEGDLEQGEESEVRAEYAEHGEENDFVRDNGVEECEHGGHSPTDA